MFVSIIQECNKIMTNNLKTTELEWKTKITHVKTALYVNSNQKSASFTAMQV